LCPVPLGAADPTVGVPVLEFEPDVIPGVAEALFVSAFDADVDPGDAPLAGTELGDALALAPTSAGAGEVGPVSVAEPHGVGCPAEPYWPGGCVGVGAGTVCPFTSAIAKRVVHVMFFV
jgi:hypothetical protein